MIQLVKTSKAKFWHIKNQSINETLCGVNVGKAWKNKSVTVLPNNICKVCLSSINFDVEADKTNKHSTWD